MDKIEMNIVEVLKHLPHRYPFVLIDRVLEIEPGKRLVGIKNVTINEQFFAGHFPNWPIMPGVLILEALAQASVILAFVTMGNVPSDDSLYVLAGLEDVRFKRVVEPGDQLRLEVSLEWKKHHIWKIKAVASVEGEIACSAYILSSQLTAKKEK